MISFVVSPEDEGRRIDVVVAARAGLPRGAVQGALKSGAVTVDGATAKPSHRVTAGELIEGLVDVVIEGPPQGEDIPLDIRFENDRLLVVCKPAGLVTHPGAGNRTGTLVNALLGSGRSLADTDGERPGIVHRLDRETSGLLLVAKDNEALAFLQGELRERRVDRRYWALVRGVPKPESGSIDAPIARHPNKRRVMTVRPEGRPAVTHYVVIGSGAGIGFLRITLESGRTHQIRVHLSHLGHPVLGDRTYGGVGEASRRLELERPFLHAFSLRFPDPDGGDPIEVRAELPPDLTAVLERAGLAVPG